MRVAARLRAAIFAETVEIRRKKCYHIPMNAVNYDKLMQKELEEGRGKTLLLHCCCAPCSSACLNRLKDSLKVTVLFYNPNIEDGEYERRKAELCRLISETGWADILDCDHEKEKFYAAVKGLEHLPEGGARCAECFKLRLTKTAREADRGNFDYFATTLTVSPLKDAALINAVGESVQGRAKWLHSDFKKRDGYLESCELSKRFGLYRQNYCGCIFSQREAKNS